MAPAADALPAAAVGGLLAEIFPGTAGAVWVSVDGAGGWLPAGRCAAAAMIEMTGPAGGCGVVVCAVGATLAVVAPEAVAVPVAVPLWSVMCDASFVCPALAPDGVPAACMVGRAAPGSAVAICTPAPAVPLS
ncbi:MAG: hypothetical protein B7Z76_13910 [Acidiphilium sp. 20-67-58]|nr:MAG: hypothetical protein B7Z76_13910 [Acidiphilium sp. 20-67-58]